MVRAIAGASGGVSTRVAFSTAGYPRQVARFAEAGRLRDAGDGGEGVRLVRGCGLGGRRGLTEIVALKNAGPVCEKCRSRSVKRPYRYRHRVSEGKTRVLRPWQVEARGVSGQYY